MFNHLVESTSHSREFKRRGSFLLGVFGLYVLLFSAAGVVSVVAYNAQLETQNLELVSLITPVESRSEVPTLARPVRGSDGPVPRDHEFAIRTQAPPSSDPTKTKFGVSSQTNQIPPPAGPWKFGGTNSDPASSGSMQIGDGGGSAISFGNSNIRPADSDPPPVKPKAPADTKPPAVKRTGGVLNGVAKYLPQPVYPQIAIVAHASGEVQVEILIDENGKVISARAVSGHVLLRPAAEQAALRARFSPTFLTNVPVKVSGVIKYEFIRQ